MPGKDKGQSSGQKVLKPSTANVNLQVRGACGHRIRGTSPSEQRKTPLDMGQTYVVQTCSSPMREKHEDQGGIFRSREKWNLKAEFSPAVDSLQAPSAARARHRAVNQMKADHERVRSQLESRCLKLKVALTYWRSRGCSGLVGFLIKSRDESLIVDLLPIVTDSLVKDKKCLEIAACVELFPLLKPLLDSKNEQHVGRVIDFLKQVVIGSKEELLAVKSSKKADLGLSRSIPEIYVFIVSVRETVQRLSTQDGKLGEAAKAFGEYIRQI